jgi:hypothetical protein
MMMSARDDEQAYLSGMAALLGDADADVFSDPALRHCLFASQHEALHQGPLGMAWEQVAFVGPWDTDLAAVRCGLSVRLVERGSVVQATFGERSAMAVARRVPSRASAQSTVNPAAAGNSR